MTSQPALIFDFGNVIAFFDFGRAASRLAPRLGISGGELLARWQRLGWDQLHREYEHGRLASLDFGQRLLALVDLSVPHDEFAAAWSDIFTANESIVPVLDSLRRQGYRLILGSNTNDLHAIRFRDQFAATLDHFDHLVLSFEVGAMKPAEAFYLACATAAGRPPTDCVFIDDLVENIAGARACGMTGLLYRSTPELIAGLGCLGIEVDA